MPQDLPPRRRGADPWALLIPFTVMFAMLSLFLGATLAADLMTKGVDWSLVCHRLHIGD